MASKCVRVFSDRAAYRADRRAYLADILRPYFKDREFGDSERIAMYGISEAEIAVGSSLSLCDVAVLPLTWNWYVENAALGEAFGFVESARRLGKPVVSYVSGDRGVRIPRGFEDVFVVRASGLRRHAHPRQLAQPVFFENLEHRFPDLVGYPAPDERQPWVGFCGQASSGYFRALATMLRTLGRNCACRFGLVSEDPDWYYPPSMLRARAMELLGASPRVRTLFLRRARYRAGASTQEAISRTTREFYENIARTNYTLCVRGGGNFSKRLYEVLAMGRIPILLDTDCLLPFEDSLNWSRYCVRVPFSQLNSLVERVMEDHEVRRRRPAPDVAEEVRHLHRDWLSFAGFHRRLLAWVLRFPSTGGSVPSEFG